MKRSEGVRGVTLVEMMIAVLMLMIAFWAFYEVVVRSTDANDYVMAFTDMCSTAQKAVNDIREDLSVAKLIFRNDTPGQSYLAAVSLPSQFPILGQSRLPGAREGGLFEADTAATNYTGNVLLFVRTEEAYLGNLGYATDVSKYRLVRVDLYRLVIYYLSKVTNAPIGGVSTSLNLVRASSALYADYSQCLSANIVDPQPTQEPALDKQVLYDLYNTTGIRYLWDTSAAAGSAFYAIVPGVTAANYTISASPDNAYRPPMTAPMEFVRNLRFRHSSVSWNTGSNFRSSVTVPSLGYATSSGDGFPHGFEIQVIGISGARQTEVNLTLARQIGAQRIAAHRAHIIVASKDYF